MTNEEIMKIVLSNYKRIAAYYPYPTGGYGQENVIAETDNFNGSKYDEPLRNFVNLIIQLGAAAAGYKPDNKTGVQLLVDGLDFPVYCYMYDGKFCITKQIKTGKEVTQMLWLVGY